MTEESLKAEQLQGYQFFRHPDLPTVGVLRLDTENENHFVLVTKESLQELAKACLQHAKELSGTQ